MWPAHRIQKHFLKGLEIAPKLRRLDPLELRYLTAPHQENRRSRLGIFKEFVHA